MPRCRCPPRAAAAQGAAGEAYLNFVPPATPLMSIKFVRAVVKNKLSPLERFTAGGNVETNPREVEVRQHDIGKIVHKFEEIQLKMEIVEIESENGSHNESDPDERSAHVEQCAQIGNRTNTFEARIKEILNKLMLYPIFI
ncbi:hypothetical protein EVAR_9996_1 [Eumeta japonica]|uniref:Uncharacterized protein n=1 Tax=Eumeta variegata TaxID=151549 RepID=A0A4C1TR02_EUMVA|nr:hypothetical protein EVAR_9996_1 [Eumeta japonica]